MSFSNLKRNSNNFDKLNKKLQELNSNTKSYADERYWKPTTDTAGNGQATIRFLPEPEGEDFPFVKIYDHFFKGETGYYVEKSLTTIGKDDPVGELNSKLWNMSDSDDSPTRKQARKQKRRLKYHSNILVINDPANPENNGKTFLFEYGAKIFGKINEAMNPPFDDTNPFNPFDFWSGANFKIRIRKVEGYPNYDLSSFDGQSVLFDDDDKLEAIYKQEHSLQALVAPSEFKSYDELKAKLDKVLGLTSVGESVKEVRETLREEAPKEVREEKPKEETPPFVVDDDDDDDFFRRLAEED